MLIGRRPVLPVLVLAAAPDGETEGTIGQLALVPGDRPQLWICVQDAPERVWARITIKIQKGDSTPLIRHGSAVTPSPEGEGFTEDEGRGTKDGRRGALVCAATGRRTRDEEKGD